MAFHLTAPTLAPFGSTKKLDVFQRIKYPSQNEEEIKPKTLKPRTVKDDTLETLILVKHFFSLLDIAFGETKCANLTVLTNLSKERLRI